MDPARPDLPTPTEPQPEGTESRRRGLARTIAKSGRASRAQAEAMVHSGRVKVDGKVVFDPAHPVGPETAVVVDGEPLSEVVRRYFAFHKPLHVVTTAAERERRRAMGDFFPSGIPGLRPAGRLDAETTGLVLVSNDAIWNDNAAGGAGFEKEYQVKVSGSLNQLELDVLSAGLHIPKIGFVRPLSLGVESSGTDETTLRVVTRDGKNRQIRRLFSVLRHEVLSLHRVRIGPVSLGDLPPGGMRPLTAAEVEQIRHARARPRPVGRAAENGAGAPPSPAPGQPAVEPPGPDRPGDGSSSAPPPVPPKPPAGGAG